MTIEKKKINAMEAILKENNKDRDNFFVFLGELKNSVEATSGSIKRITAEQENQKKVLHKIEKQVAVMKAFIPLFYTIVGMTLTKVFHVLF